MVVNPSSLYKTDYCDKKVQENFLQRPAGCEAVRALTQHHGHLSVGDSSLLSRVLEETVFTNIQEVSFRQGTDKRLLKDREERAWETLYMESQKPEN